MSSLPVKMTHCCHKTRIICVAALVPLANIVFLHLEQIHIEWKISSLQNEWSKTKSRPILAFFYWDATMYFVCFSQNLL